MNCSNCGRPLDPGAAFCGNCGQPVDAAATTQAAQPQQAQPQPAAAPAQTVPAQAAPAPIAPAPGVQPPMGGPAAPQPAMAAGGVPAYATAPATHPGEVKAIIGLIAGILSIPGALIPIAALVLGVVGVVLGSITLHLKKLLAVLALIFGGVGIILGVIAWVYNIQHDPRLHHLSSATSLVTTPCYSVNLSKDLHVKGSTDTCNIQAMNGSDLTHSSVVLDFHGASEPALNSSNLATAAEKVAPTLLQSINTSQSVRKYKLDSQNSGEFAGEPAYFYNVSAPDGTHGEIALVLHSAANGDNAFEIDEFVLNDKVNLDDLASNWTWR